MKAQSATQLFTFVAAYCWIYVVKPQILSELVVNNDVVVTTKIGKVRGQAVRQFGVDEGIMFTRFLGIPYAYPPQGELRFRPPKPHPGWTGILNAKEHGSICPHDVRLWKKILHPSVYMDRVKLNRTEEDCLFLDIYVPRDLATTPSISLPVMVFFHGGQFQNEAPMLYGGARLAYHGDVIVVGVHYRLGVLGFLSTGSDSAKGNFGLLDQRLALMWVKDNIASFGGNPESVTIFGESSGAVSVSHHVLSPMCRGLFRRAISQSGTANSPCCEQKDPQSMVISLADHLNCTFGMNRSNYDYFRMVSCLRTIPTDRIIHTATEVSRKHSDNWYPVIDGDFITGEALSLLNDRLFASIDYLIGVNSHEGYSLSKSLMFDINKGVSERQFTDTIRTKLESQFEGSIEKVLSLVRTEYGHCSKTNLERAEALVDFLGERRIIAPSISFAQHYSRSGANTYFYVFNHRPSFGRPNNNFGQDLPYFMGADHGDELNFVFGHARFLIPNATEAERRLSSAMMKAWGNFARTGDPNPFTRVRYMFWKSFSEENPHYMEFSANMSKDSLKSSFRPRRMAFWNDYLVAQKEHPDCLDLEPFGPKVGASSQDDRQVLVGVIIFLVIVVILLAAILIVLIGTLYMKRRKREGINKYTPSRHDKRDPYEMNRLHHHVPIEDDQTERKEPVFDHSDKEEDDREETSLRFSDARDYNSTMSNAHHNVNNRHRIPTPPPLPLPP